MWIPMVTLRELMDYHYDRRERLYQFLSKVKPEEFVRPMNIGWSNIRTTLVHCLFAEEFWILHALQKKQRPEFEPAKFKDLPSVISQANEVRSRTLEFVEGLTEEALSREESITFSDGTAVRFTLSKAFLHLITHDAHHRGQVVAMARQLGYEPPEIDLI